MTYPHNTSFSRDIPKLQLAWDSVSSGALKKCPRFYEYEIIEGYQQGRDLGNDHTHFGILIHCATEVYEKERAQGISHNDAVINGVYYLLINTWDFVKKRPWISAISTKTRKTAIRTFILYCDKYEDDLIKTRILSNGQPAIEVSFRIDLSEIDGSFVAPDGNSYLLCGHLDKVGDDVENRTYIPDKKTTGYDLNNDYFSQYSPDNQVSIYSLAGRIVLLSEVDGVIIDGIQVLAGGTRFARRAIPRTEAQLVEWLTDFKYRLRENERYVADNYWPMNDKSCGFGSMQCGFRPICSQPPEFRQSLLDAFYSSRRVWDPLIPR